MEAIAEKAKIKPKDEDAMDMEFQALSITDRIKKGGLVCNSHI